MRITSTLANITTRNPETGRAERRLVMDTSIEGKTFVTAIVQSRDGGQHLTEIGQGTVDMAGAHHQAYQNGGATHLVQVMARAVVRRRVADALTGAKTGSLVIFFGASDDICADLMKALGLQRVGGGQDARH